MASVSFVLWGAGAAKNNTVMGVVLVLDLAGGVVTVVDPFRFVAPSPSPGVP